MVFNDNLHDCDSTQDVWGKLYSVIYKDTFNHIFDFENIQDSETSKSCKRLYIKIDKIRQPDLAERYPKFKVAGDCIFNFNEKKIKLFIDLVGEGKEELVLLCKKHHHSLVNFSFMPITGGLNSTKGFLRCENGTEKKSFDRPDVLIAELAKYYNGMHTRIFRKRNREALEWYLKLFADRGVEGYCKDIYLVDDEKMLQRFLKLAKKPICDSETAIEYMELACDYWKMKESKLRGFGITEF